MMMSLSSSLLWMMLLILASVSDVQGDLLGEIRCEELPVDRCAFAIASSGKRCLLETTTDGDGDGQFQCTTSEVVVERMSAYIETDRCVRACGVDRKTIGISSDSLLEPLFVSNLCSPRCYLNCPSIVDLYFNLAAAEGVFLSDICTAQRTNQHRYMLSELISNGAAAVPVPAPSPAPAASL